MSSSSPLSDLSKNCSSLGFVRVNICPFGAWLFIFLFEILPYVSFSFVIFPLLESVSSRVDFSLLTDLCLFFVSFRNSSRLTEIYSIYHATSSAFFENRCLLSKNKISSVEYRAFFNPILCNSTLF